MPKFKFKLEAVRKHRTMLEVQSMQTFAVAQGDLAACTARITALHLEFQQVVSSRPSTVDVEEIALRERYLDGLRSRIEQQERLREGLEARLDDARTALVKSRQDRQTVDRLRETQLSEHNRLELKTEQDAMDELATLRYTRKAVGS